MLSKRFSSFDHYDNDHSNNLRLLNSSFENLNLSDKLLRGIYAYGFNELTSIQQQGILAVVRNRNCIIQSRMGTQRTSSYAIGCLQKIDYQSKYVQTIILTPTREFSYNVCSVIKQLSDCLNIGICLCVGGTSIRETINLIDNGVQIIIGTTGRIYDLILRNIIKGDTVKQMVIDEIEEINQFGFGEYLTKVMKFVPNANMMICTSSFPKEIKPIVQKFLENPLEIIVE
ncbi:RNA helicase [Entamoeba marina]